MSDDADPVQAIAHAAGGGGDGDKPKKKKGGTTRPRQTKGDQIEIIRKGLTELFIIGAAGAQMFHHDECPQDIVKGAPAMADAWAKLAERNKRIRDALVSLVTVSDWGGVFMTTGMVVLPMLRRHGVLPDTFALPGIEAETTHPEPTHPDPIAPTPAPGSEPEEEEEDGLTVPEPSHESASL